ncbi:MAG: MMPL family transporter [Ilumatobacteraceae bacterium]|nr:MMPL family transporter [Ilumatobacteraceae bacterium]
MTSNDSPGNDRWRSLGHALSRRTGRTLAAALVVTAVMAIGLARLDFATGQDSYIDPSSQVAKDNERYQTLFGGENMVVLFTAAPGKSIVDLFGPDNVAQFAEVEEELSTSAAVQSVVSPVTLLTWTQDLVLEGVASEILARAAERDPDPAAAALRQQDGLITVQRLGGAGEQSFDNPEWVKFLLFGNDGFTIGTDGKLVAPADDALMIRKPLRAFIPDANHAILAAVLVGNAQLDELAVGSDAVKAAFEGRTFDNAAVTITGTPTFLTDINDYLQGGMLTLGGIAVLVMIVILLVAFRVRWRLLPLLGMVAGVAWGFGAFGFTGTKLSLVTIAGLPILIGLGIEFAIQVQNRLEEERTVAGEKDPFGETMVTMGPPLLAATIAAVIAFLTVKISRVPMVQDFGILLAIGIVALLIAGIVLPTTIIGARERHSPTTVDPGASWVEKTVARLGSLPRRAVLPLVLVAVALPIAGLFLETGSKIESDPVNWADQSSESIVNARILERETGFATTLGVFIETTGDTSNGVFTDQSGAFVFDLVQRSLGENADLAQASSLATAAGWLAEVPGATPLPPTGLDMLQAYESAPVSLQALLVADNGNSTQVLFQVGPSSLEERSVVLDKVEQAIIDPGEGARLPANASATTGGLAVVGVGLLENITANRAELTIVALILVGAFVTLRYRDLARGLLTMIPVLLAVGTSTVLVRVLGITLSPLTTVGGPLVVATCAEFAVLLVARYSEERARGLDPERSTHVAAQRTGRAFFTSALTTLGGFAVLMFSTLPLLRDFGIVVTINIAVALLSALIVVPPLVKEADRRGLLSMGPNAGHEGAHTRGRSRTVTGLVAGAALAVLGLAMAFVAVSRDTPAVAAPLTAAAEAPATLPPPTTVAPTTTPPSTIPGQTTLPPELLPPGPAERPSGLVAGIFWDGLVAVGVNPGVARCAADDLIATTSEADLIAQGIATTPRPAAVNALLDGAAKRCGVTQEQLDAAAAAAGG